MIKDTKAKQFSMEDMLDFAIAMEEKSSFDISSVEIWYKKKLARLERLKKYTKASNSNVTKSKMYPTKIGQRLLEEGIQQEFNDMSDDMYYP